MKKLQTLLKFQDCFNHCVNKCKNDIIWLHFCMAEGLNDLNLLDQTNSKSGLKGFLHLTDIDFLSLFNNNRGYNRCG